MWTETRTGPIAISSVGPICARVIFSPFFLVPLVLRRCGAPHHQ
jgi:hypothetical protein